MKKTIIPVIMVSMPILTIIAPYIIVRYVMKLPLSFSDYIVTAKNTYFSQMGGGGGPGSSLKQLLQLGGFIFTTAHSIYQPIQTMMHVRSIDSTVRTKADDIIRGVEIYERIRTVFDEYGVKTPRLPLPTDIMTDRYRIVAFVREHSFYIRLLLDWIGTWDVYVAIAQAPTVTCVEWTSGQPEIYIASTCDTRIRPEKQKKFTIQLGGGKVQNNILLTGPNRGGKSTVLRALIRSVLLAHTYGVAIGSSCKMSPLDWVKSSLRIEDLPGSESLFEREIAFAKDTLSSSPATSGLVCIDEIFHSTNPPDSERTARKYLTSLWQKTNTLSVISTHIYPIAEDAPEKTVRRMCCPADELADGRVIYHYGLTDGICKVSSVNDIIKGAFDN
jgi:hypothetical protein